MLDCRGALDEERDRVGADEGRQRGVGSFGSESVGTSTTTSPVTPSACLLVARIRRPGQARSRAAARTAAASRTCSQLSRISRARLSPMRVAERGGRPARRPILEPERGERRLDHQRGILDWRELDEPDPVRELACRFASRSQGELGLADTARAGERQQPGAAERASNIVELLAPSYETRQFDWQVAGRQGGPLGRQGSWSLVRATARRQGRAPAPGGQARWVLPVLVRRVRNRWVGHRCLSGWRREGQRPMVA